MPISYTELSTYSLLQNKITYDIINDVCANKFKDWDIKTFERQVIGEKHELTYSENDVRFAIHEKLLELDKNKPYLRYLEKGTHYGFELFMCIPDVSTQPYSFTMFWSHISRVFSTMILPIEEKEFRTIYFSEMEKFGMRPLSNNTYKIPEFAINIDYYNEGSVSSREIREALYIVENRNRAFKKRMNFNEEPIYLDFVKKILEERAENFSTKFITYKLRSDFDFHNLCFAIDSSCTTKQRDRAFDYWGMFNGAKRSYVECGRSLGVSSSCIRQYEAAAIRNVVRDKSMIFEILNK